jgi:hypothetical protein
MRGSLPRARAGVKLKRFSYLQAYSNAPLVAYLSILALYEGLRGID